MISRTTIALHAGLLAALLGAASPPAALADLVLTQRETGPSPEDGGRLTTEKEISITRDKMRIVDLESGSIVIVRLDRRVVWEIPPEATEYIEIPFDYLTKMKDFQNMSEEEILEAQIELADPAVRDNLRRALADVRRRDVGKSSEEGAVRDSVRAERARLGSQRPEVAWTGRTERIAGFATREAVLTVGAAKVAEAWVTDDRFFKEELDAYGEAMESLSMIGGSQPADLAALGGFPLRTVLYPLGRSAREAEAEPLVIEIIEARRESLAPWEFDIPPGVERAPFLPLGMDQEP